MRISLALLSRSLFPASRTETPRRVPPTATILLVGCAALLLAPQFGHGQVVQERPDSGVVQRIREEGFTRSQLPELAGYLTDVIGPRLTRSPAMRRANDWTAEKLRGWKLDRVTVEPWGERVRSWENVMAYARVLTPYPQMLNVSPVAWTGSTDGRVTGPVLAVDAETAEEVVQKYRGKLRHTWVIGGPPREIPLSEGEGPFRLSADSLVAPVALDTTNAAAALAERQERMAAFRVRLARNRAIDSLAAAEGAHGQLVYSGRLCGLLDQFGNLSAMHPKQPLPRSKLAVGVEQYGQIWRNVQRGIPVALEADIQNDVAPEVAAHHTFGDIRGSEKANEYVMIGAHLDSWHGGTGATDNAAGVVVVMEAMRILRTLDLVPKRTIRVALWSGEEQGIHGSRRWLATHPELHERISAYLNVDYGTGRIRGIYSGDNDEAAGVFEQVFRPLHDLGVVAVRRGEEPGSSDNWAFNQVGIPGFSFIQDPLDYWAWTHHTNADRYERLVMDDLKQAAVVVAVTAYHLANREKMLPREQKPSPVR